MTEGLGVKAKATEPPSGALRQRDAGTWNGDDVWQGEGGQVMQFVVKNLNVLGTTIHITDQEGRSQGSIIGPFQTATFRFDMFGSEPMDWRLNIGTDSDVFTVGWSLQSTWIPGDPPNR